MKALLFVAGKDGIKNMNHVHISRGNSKLGPNIPSVNLPPVVTCRIDAPCIKKCYARKGRFSMNHNKELLKNNLEIWKTNPAQYEHDILNGACFHAFFRYHSAGDIPDANYLKMMVRVAYALPNTRFLAFTKKFELVNGYIAEHGALPENLKIVFSAWGCFLPENPYNLPVAYIRFKKCECDIPQNAHHCSKFCGDCVMSGMSCWDLNCGESVYFDEH